MDENMEKKSTKSGHFLGAANNLLESIIEKDEAFRNSIENSLIRMVECKPNETLAAICEFRQKNVKLGEHQIAIIMRITEKCATTLTPAFSEEILPKVIDLCINEMIKYQEHCPNVQNPAVGALVAIGRIHCDKVMEGLTKQLHQGHVAHFMILHCMGTLATANISGIYNFIKPTLEKILPTLAMVRLDHAKQAYAFGIGHFAEAITEHILQHHPRIIEDTFHGEIAIAYEMFMHQWLPNREPKVSADILQALSNMYPLLSLDKISEQAAKVIPQIFRFYRRSMDRNAITQLLASVLKTSIETDSKSLDPQSDLIISSLFDLVCVNPDYEKPQTVKGHYEVLRCYDLLVEIYSNKVFELLLIQLRSNNERDRIKSLLVITHLTNTFDFLISPKISEFMPLLKQMLLNEKSFKVKMALLKAIVALSQKDVATDAEFVKFMLRNSCNLVKINPEHGTIEESTDLVEACSNSLFILASTVRTVDVLMRQVLLQHYLMIDYTDISSNIAKCLANLFIKSTDPSFMEIEDTGDEMSKTKSTIPSPESVFIRSLVLLGNTDEAKRGENVLNFLRFYCPLINSRFASLWKEKIPELIELIGKEGFLNELYSFLILSIKASEDNQFPETLVSKIADQLVLYPVVMPDSEYLIPKFSKERGMSLKILGLCICYISDNQTIESKIDLIVNIARQEKVDKNTPNSHAKLADACEALGFASQIHFGAVLKKLDNLLMDDGKQKSFFAGLNFIRDTNKEAELYKSCILAMDSYGHIVQIAPQNKILTDVESKFINYLYKQLSETKDFIIRKIALQTLLTITKQILKSKSLEIKLQSKANVLNQILKIDFTTENLPLLPMAVKLATNLQIIPTEDEYDIRGFFEEICRKTFTMAQQLKTKFESIEDDERNSYLAKYLNLTLPELNAFVKAIFEENSSPSTLDDINSVLEYWIKDVNSEVRICASHVMNNVLEVYMKTMKIGCEAPSKFNQTGSMLARIIPRCIDSNATVRQTAIEIVQKILEISCIYESLTIADQSDDWMKDLQKISEEIVTDDPKEIYRIASEIARIIALRLSNFQYLHFSKTLLLSLNDTEQSSAIGASVVLKFFIQIKGSELFHAVPEFVKDSLNAISVCPNARAKSGVLKALVALTKHHPKLVSNELLAQPLPLDANVIEFWKTVALDHELFDVIVDNFLATLSSSCLYEPAEGNDRPQIATAHPFSIFCALHELFPCKDIQSVLQKKFPEIFSTLLTSLAVYTNLAPPMVNGKQFHNPKSPTGSGKAKFGFIPNKEAVKMNPCQIVLETFQSFLDILEMEQISAVLSVCPHLSTSHELNNFIEILTPMAVGVVNQLGITSNYLRQTVSNLSKYVSSPYDPQRIAAVGLYSQIVPLRPTGEIASVIMLHLNSALSDPNPLVRGLCIRGFAFVGHLSEHDIAKYSETSLAALLKGIDDTNDNCFINIPLESIRGLSRALTSLTGSKLDTFQISLAIRIRPFYENPSADIREAAILLFGNLCECKVTISDGLDNEDASFTGSGTVTEAFKEQLICNFFSMLLHLCETTGMIVKACKITLRKLASLIDAPKVNTMIQSHLLEHGHLNYDFFIMNLMKIIAEELQDNIPDFIESCLPFLKSTWPEIRGNASVIIGLLHNLNRTNQQATDGAGQKISVLLKDEQIYVRIKAANALGFMYGNPL